MKKKYSKEDYFIAASQNDFFGTKGDYNWHKKGVSLANDIYQNQFLKEVHITHCGTETFPWEDASFACAQYCLEKAGLA
jgi:hypothetical protein